MILKMWIQLLSGFVMTLWRWPILQDYGVQLFNLLYQTFDVCYYEWNRQINWLPFAIPPLMNATSKKWSRLLLNAPEVFIRLCLPKYLSLQHGLFKLTVLRLSVAKAFCHRNAGFSNCKAIITKNDIFRQPAWTKTSKTLRESQIHMPAHHLSRGARDRPIREIYGFPPANHNA